MIDIQAEVLTNEQADVAECPVALGSRRLLWIDIPAGRVWCTNLRSRVSNSFEYGRRIGAVARAWPRGLIMASENSFYYVRRPGAEPEFLTKAFEGARATLNDGKVDPWGRFVVGSASNEGEQLGALYALHPSGTVEVLLRDITMSNGLDWSPDRSAMLYVDTPTQVIRRFELDPDTGQIIGDSEFAAIAREIGLPDGLAVDALGFVWVAVWGSRQVLGFDPSGEQIARIHVPTDHPTSCAFGGKDLRTLFITSARPPASAGDSLAGGIFEARMPNRGKPCLPFNRAMLAFEKIVAHDRNIVS